jgi:hypothetical protein
MAARGVAAFRVFVAVCGFLVTFGCSAFEDFEREGSETVEPAERARFSMSFQPAQPGEALPREFAGSYEGEIVEGGDTARLSMEIPSVPGGILGPDIEFIFLEGGPVYIRPIADPESLPEGKTWVLVELSQLSQVAPGMEQFITFLTNDRLLQAKDLDEDDQIGTEVVRGVETTVYSSSVEVEEMADVVGLSEQQVADMRSMVGDDARFKFWLDGEGFIRRMEMPASLPPDIGDVEDPVVFRIELYDYDGDFDVSIPPESEVMKE